MRSIDIPPLTRTDVLVIGAGPAGVAAALAVRSRETSVVVTGRPARRPAGLSHEVLPGGARPIIGALGVADADVYACTAPLRCFSSTWGTLNAQLATRTMEHYGGWYVIDRTGFDRMLLRHALTTQVRYRPAALRRITATPGGYVVECDDGRAIACRFIIDATGRRCAVARRLGAHVRVAHRLFAVASRVNDADRLFDAATAVIATAAHGWSFTLPVAENICLAQSFASLRSVNRAVIAAIRLNSDCVRAASTTVTDPLAGDRWLTVGDAAIALDPVASSGLAMALKSGIRGGLAAASALLGDNSAIAEFTEALHGYFTAFLAERQQLYAMERRFGAEDFWQEQVLAAAVQTRQECVRPDRDHTFDLI